MFVKLCGPCLNRSREIRPDAIGGGIFNNFFRDHFRPDVVSDVIYGTTEGYVGMDVPVKLDDSRSTR